MILTIPRILQRSITLPVIFSVVLAMFFILCSAPSAPAAFAGAQIGEKPYSADVMLKEVGHAPKVCGSVLVAHGKARLEMDLGTPGKFQAIFLPEEKTLIILSESLKGYVTLPVTGVERDLRALVMQAAKSIMPTGVGAVDIQETDVENLGNKVWQGWSARVTRARYLARMMGAESSIKLEMWENAALAPFPLRLININNSKSGDTVELVNISTSPTIPQDAFLVPGNYTRYTSVLNLLLYAITGF